jgi:hypothetical protein
MAAEDKREVSRAEKKITARKSKIGAPSRSSKASYTPGERKRGQKEISRRD